MAIVEHVRWDSYVLMRLYVFMLLCMLFTGLHRQHQVSTQRLSDSQRDHYSYIRWMPHLLQLPYGDGSDASSLLASVLHVI